MSTSIGSYDLNGNWCLPQGDTDDPDASSGVYSDLGLVMTNAEYDKHAQQHEYHDDHTLTVGNNNDAQGS